MTAAETIHLHPTAALSERVLLPGDPGRALALAQTLLEKPLMFNHNRGLWGYTGMAQDGQSLTIQATGMGGPSAAIVLSELITLGAQRAIRIGSCGALKSGMELGEVVIANEAICLDGASRALGANERVRANEELTQALQRYAPKAHCGAVVSVDLFYEPGPVGGGVDALAVEMEAATLLALGASESIPVACVLFVSDTFGPDGTRQRIDAQAQLSAGEAIGRAALAALSD